MKKNAIVVVRPARLTAAYQLVKEDVDGDVHEA